MQQCAIVMLSNETLRESVGGGFAGLEQLFASTPVEKEVAVEEVEDQSLHGLGWCLENDCASDASDEEADEGTTMMSGWR